MTARVRALVARGGCRPLCRLHAGRSLGHPRTSADTRKAARFMTLSTFARISGPLTGATFLTGVFGGIALSDRRYPIAGSPHDDIRDYYENNPASAALSAAGQLASSLFLAQFAMTNDALAIKAGRPSLRWANAVGASVAVAALATSGVTTARLCGPARHDAVAAGRLARLSFVAGGPVHGFGFGLMTGTLTYASGWTGTIGAGWQCAGLLATVAGLLSPAYFAAEQAGWLIPIGRFVGLALLAAAGPRLSRTRW
jgi:hypothetical protein